MKLNFHFLIAVVALTTFNARAQNRFVESALNVAFLVPGNEGCRINTKPCAVINKATNRTITVKVEESFVVNNTISKKIIVVDKLAPGEKRFVGCAGVPKDTPNDEDAGYKILLAYYDEPDSTGLKNHSMSNSQD